MQIVKVFLEQLTKNHWMVVENFVQKSQNIVISNSYMIEK